MKESYFYKNLKKILEKYSQADAAKILEVSPKSISNYLNGKSPNMRTLRKAEEIVTKLETGKSITPTLGVDNNEMNETDLHNTKLLIDMLSKQTDIIKSQQETIHYLTTNKGNVTAVSSM